MRVAVQPDRVNLEYQLCTCGISHARRSAPKAATPGASAALSWLLCARRRQRRAQREPHRERAERGPCCTLRRPDSRDGPRCLRVCRKASHRGDGSATHHSTPGKSPPSAISSTRRPSGPRARQPSRTPPGASETTSASRRCCRSRSPNRQAAAAWWHRYAGRRDRGWRSCAPSDSADAEPPSPGWACWPRPDQSPSPASRAAPPTPPARAAAGPEAA